MWFEAELIPDTSDGESCRGLLVSSVQITFKDPKNDFVKVGVPMPPKLA